MVAGELGKRVRKEPERLVAQAPEPKKKRTKAGKASGKKKAAGGKATGKKKDGAKKRPLSSFLLYSQEHRGAVVKKHPDFKVGEVAKVLGEMWKKASAAEKKKYVDAAAKAKAAWERSK
eukprot:CAMPEP_0175845368 /NCGR_PEP_ID=MMETSP0107_2-20121207/22179_1 /TAXON_ID=195067 ORGANISM="Goniomonas pacifica, Strain CCMP1869" /NCGR_SAMPLE_ID=MMETSP0107_2 /ASSEMBLY_ACC=CAM_ASM_000203 /LENGTH=118 /DNA_ID=CAMNT_0017159905 /DNA_START=25 /DNA_END=381 /DNA_ORIENTATION=-